MIMRAMSPSFYRLAALLFCLGFSGCAAAAKGTVRDRQLLEALAVDREYTLQKVPLESPQQRVASFRIAAEGQRALGEGRFQEAEDRLERALSLDPRNPFCYFYLAEIRFRSGNVQQALMLLGQSEVLFQGHPYWLSEVYTKKGLYFEELRSTEEARRAYLKALEYNPWNEEPSKGLQRVGPSKGSS